MLSRIMIDNIFHVPHVCPFEKLHSKIKFLKEYPENTSLKLCCRDAILFGITNCAHGIVWH